MTALQFALKKLARRSMHSARLRQLMIEVGFDDSECQETIDYLAAQGFLNDADYVRYFVSKWQTLGKSRHEILMKARHYCVPASQITPLIQDEKEALAAFIRKRYPLLLSKNIDTKSKQKGIMAVKRKGFSLHTIIELLKS